MKDRNIIIKITIFIFFIIIIFNAFETNNNLYENFYTKFQQKRVSTAYNTKINGTIGLHQEYEIIVGTEKYFFFNYTQADTGEMISNCSLKYCEWYNENNASQIYNTTLTETPEGLYKLDINTPNLDVGNYFLVITLGKENYTQRTAIINLRITNFKNMNFIFYQNNYTIASGEALKINISLVDAVNKSSIIGANVSFQFEGNLYSFIDKNNGNYSILVDNFKVLDYGTPSKNYSILLLIQKEYYNNISIELNIMVYLRKLDYNLSASNLIGNSITIDKSENIFFTIKLNDSLNKSKILNNAYIRLIFDSNTYIFQATGNNSYSLTLSTDKYDTFANSKNFISHIIIQLQNYERKIVYLYIKINIEDFIPGFPMIYFFNLLLGIGGFLFLIFSYYYLKISNSKKTLKM